MSVRKRSWTTRLTALDGKDEVARYCVHASYDIPLGDQLLAQMLSLRLDEDHVESTKMAAKKIFANEISNFA